MSYVLWTIAAAYLAMAGCWWHGWYFGYGGSKALPLAIGDVLVAVVLVAAGVLV